MNDNKLNYIQNGQIYICGRFDSSIVEILGDIENLIQSQEQLQKKELVFNINSYGGDVSVLMSLLTYIDLAKSKGFKIITNNLANAHSAAAVLFIAGDDRKMGKNSEVLFHFGSSQAFSRSSTELTNNFTAQRNIEKQLKALIKDQTKLTNKQVDYIHVHDGIYIYPEECVEFGIADEIIGGANEKPLKGVLSKMKL